MNKKRSSNLESNQGHHFWGELAGLLI